MQFTQQEKYKDNIILKLSFEFAKDIVAFSEELESKRKFTFAGQILRSGTSIGANIKEAQNAESKADFIHKFKIAMKEADELEYWHFLFVMNAMDTPKQTFYWKSYIRLLKLQLKLFIQANKMFNRPFVSLAHCIIGTWAY